jgi:outer membrane protein assembly factor BamA
LRYRNFPDRFYGIGNNTSKEAEEFYSYDYISFKTLQMKQVKPHLFVGFDYHFEYEYNFTYRNAEGQLATGSVPGYKGGVGSALGLVAVFDSRDNVVNAHKGRYAEFSSYLFEPLWGSTFEYLRLTGIHQQYFKLPNTHVVAIQQVASFNFGEVPFLDMSTVGSEVILRGYPKNRFRDKHFLATQAEYRAHLFWRLGAVAFAGVGDVFDSADDLRMDRLKYSVGAGLRFLVNPKERLNIRFDYGIGREGGYYYFSVTESF